jgi:hypothetical protein
MLSYGRHGVLIKGSRRYWPLGSDGMRISGEIGGWMSI